MNYTERVDGFQITDVTYIGLPPEGTAPTYAVVKWYKTKPMPALNMDTGEITMSNEFCCVVAHLIWDKKEPCFDLHSVGLRWLEEKPTEAVRQMILDFCEKKGRELQEAEEW